MVQTPLVSWQELIKAWAVPVQDIEGISAGKSAWDTIINNKNKGYILIAAELL